jgi:Tol biopolymer transport system component
MCCSPDGKELLVSMGYDIGVLSLENPESNSPTPFIQGNHDQRLATWSGDGKWVAYISEETGSWEVYVEPYPGPGPRTTISTQGGIQPVWARDGKELYYRSGDKIMAVSVDTESELKVLDSKILFKGNYLYCLNCQTYDVAPDGRFLMIQDPLEPATPRINVILNWAEELKRLAPLEKK